MSGYWNSSEYYSNNSSSGESSHISRDTNPTDLSSDFESPAPHFNTTPEIAALHNLPDGGTIDPQLLDLRLGNAQQSFEAASYWAGGSQLNGRTLSDGEIGARGTQDALQSMQSWPHQPIGQPPYIPGQQVWQPSLQSYHGSSRSVATGPAALVEGETFATGSIGQGIDQPTSLTSTAPNENRVPIPRSTSTSQKSDSSSSNSITCKDCGESFGRDGDLKRHRDNHHGASPTFRRCEECGFDDVRLDKVKEHCRMTHGQQRGAERYTVEAGTPSRVKRYRSPNKNPRKTRVR